MPEIRKNQIWITYETLGLVAKNADQLTDIIRTHSSRKVIESRILCAAAEMAPAVRHCSENHLF